MVRAIRIAAFCLLAACATMRLAADAEQTKSGTIKSVDATAKSFVLDLAARPLTFGTDEKTTITLDGKALTFAAAIKAAATATVTYTRAGDVRTATKVEVTTAAATAPAK